MLAHCQPPLERLLGGSLLSTKHFRLHARLSLPSNGDMAAFFHAADFAIFHSSATRADLFNGLNPRHPYVQHNTTHRNCGEASNYGNILVMVTY